MGEEYQATIPKYNPIMPYPTSSSSSSSSSQPLGELIWSPRGISDEAG